MNAPCKLIIDEFLALTGFVSDTSLKVSFILMHSRQLEQGAAPDRVSDIAWVLQKKMLLLYAQMVKIDKRGCAAIDVCD